MLLAIQAAIAPHERSTEYTTPNSFRHAAGDGLGGDGCGEVRQTDCAPSAVMQDALDAPDVVGQAGRMLPQEEAKLPATFRALKTIAQNRGPEDISVELDRAREWDDQTPRSSGEFTTGPPPTLRVYVKSGDTCDVDDIEDSISLAHEMGHHQRWLGNEEDPEYTKVADLEGRQINKKDPEPLRLAALIEEEEAWAYAKADLEAVRFHEWARFDRRRRDDLDSYRDELSNE